MVPKWSTHFVIAILIIGTSDTSLFLAKGHFLQSSWGYAINSQCKIVITKKSRNGKWLFAFPASVHASSRLPQFKIGSKPRLLKTSLSFGDSYQMKSSAGCTLVFFRAIGRLCLNFHCSFKVLLMPLQILSLFEALANFGNADRVTIFGNVDKTTSFGNADRIGKATKPPTKTICAIFSGKTKAWLTMYHKDSSHS